MPTISEIAAARKRLNGEVPSGRVFEYGGKPADPQPVPVPWPWIDPARRPDNWRKQQAGKSIRDILGK
jgi:hypothetical protein